MQFPSCQLTLGQQQSTKASLLKTMICGSCSKVTANRLLEYVTVASGRR
jgi:hypothetical protein